MAIHFSNKRTYGFYVFPAVKLSSIKQWRYSRILSAEIHWLKFTIQFAQKQEQRVVSDKLVWRNVT